MAFLLGPEMFWWMFVLLLQTGVSTTSCCQVSRIYEFFTQKFMEGIIWNQGHVMSTPSSHAEVVMLSWARDIDIRHQTLRLDQLDAALVDA